MSAALAPREGAWRAPRDPVLPQLAAALDPAFMVPLFARQLDRAGNPGEVADCRLLRAKHRPGRNASLLYAVRVGAVEQWYHAGLYRPAAAAQRYRAGLARAFLPRLGLPLAHLPEHAMVIWAFPNDRKLAALHAFAAPARLADELLPAALGACRADLLARLPTVTPVAYFPEHACTARVGVALGDGRESPLYAKIDAAGRGGATLSAMQRLWESRARREGRLAMARPLAYVRGARLLWQEALAGTPVERLLGEAAPSPALGRAVGEHLAVLHQVPLAGLPRFDAGAALARCGVAGQGIGEAFPELAGRIEQLLTALAQARPDCGHRPLATLHGDLHLNNLLADGDAIGFVDFDDLACGPAAAELGSFVAGLMYRAALHRHDDGACAEGIAAFFAGYAAAAPRLAGWDETRWFAAAALLHERAWRCLTALKPGRLALVPRLVGTAQALLGAGRASRRLALVA